MIADGPDAHASLTREAVQNLKRMIELGRRPDGTKLTRMQTEHLMTLVLQWELNHPEGRDPAATLPESCARGTDRTMAK